MTKKYFKSRIKEVNRWKATDDLTPFDIEDGFEAALTWHLPPSHVAIVRATWPDGVYEERAYKNAKAAHQFMETLITVGGEFVLMTNEGLRETSFRHD